jgi:hypothetical protein
LDARLDLIKAPVDWNLRANFYRNFRGGLRLSVSVTLSNRESNEGNP